MGDVFANGLEVSGKGVKAQTIAAFPDVCMTPPENPATPPGVPVPYPNFAMAGDTEKGSSTVKVKKKEINLKNKSDMKKTSGDEAGCAAKKGVVSSKNMGKSYFQSWSMDVKAEGEPVTRMSDMTTNNHGSPPNVLPWPHVAKISVTMANCAKAFVALKINFGPYESLECEDGYQKEHTVGQRYFGKGDQPGDKGFPNYDKDKAPCICMRTWNVHPETDAPLKNLRGETVSQPASGYRFSSTLGGLAVDPNAGGSWKCKGSPHNNKTQQVMHEVCKKRVPGGKRVTMGDVIDESAKATCDQHEQIKDLDDESKKFVSECLKLMQYNYLVEEGGGKQDGDEEITRESLRAKEVETYNSKADRMAKKLDALEDQR